MPKFFVDAVAAPQPKAKWVIPVSLGYAVVLTGMSLAQLFTLEDLIPIVNDYWLPGGAGAASLFTCVVIVAQIFALPYLLRMTISPLLRIVGAVLSFVAPLMWLGVAIYALATNRVLENGGLLGEKVPIPADGLQVAGAVILIVLAAASAYGLFELGTRKK